MKQDYGYARRRCGAPGYVIIVPRLLPGVLMSILVPQTRRFVGNGSCMALRMWWTLLITLGWGGCSHGHWVSWIAHGFPFGANHSGLAERPPAPHRYGNGMVRECDGWTANSMRSEHNQSEGAISRSLRPPSLFRLALIPVALWCH